MQLVGTAETGSPKAKQTRYLMDLFDSFNEPFITLTLPTVHMQQNCFLKMYYIEGASIISFDHPSAMLD